MKMGAPLPNERMDASDSALPVFESKGERGRASSAKQPRDTSELTDLPNPLPPRRAIN
jgi:hypothetical protein